LIRHDEHKNHILAGTVVNAILHNHNDVTSHVTAARDNSGSMILFAASATQQKGSNSSNSSNRMQDKDDNKKVFGLFLLSKTRPLFVF
jgi:hypothetical protein